MATNEQVQNLKKLRETLEEGIGENGSLLNIYGEVPSLLMDIGFALDLTEEQQLTFLGSELFDPKVDVTIPPTAEEPRVDLEPVMAGM